MKLKAITILYFLFAFTICKAQTNLNLKNNALSFELGKTGLIYNVNFDHRFKNNNLGFRLSVGSNFAKYLQAFTTGAGGYYLLGNETNFLELGIDLNYLSVDEISDDQRGFTFLSPDYPVKTLYTSANIGYRRYGKSTLFRIGVSPGLIKNDFLPGGYVSFGVRF
ncbi:MAG: hypothetical protein ABI204_05225 [Ginsengibacter sp.]